MRVTNYRYCILNQIQCARDILWPSVVLHNDSNLSPPPHLTLKNMLLILVRFMSMTPELTPVLP